MKSKSIIIAFLISLALVPAVQAKTDIIGDTYGNLVSNVSMIDITIPYGVKIADLNTTENCDTVKQTCYLDGFSWFDVVGWTYWDGKSIQTELGGPVSFPDEYIAKAAFNGNLDGFIWGEKYGWVQLSACPGTDTEIACEAKSYCDWTTNNKCAIKTGVRIPDVSTQTADDWGVYIDFCPAKTDQASCESVESNPYCNWDTADSVCVFDGPMNPNGQPLRGFAWSEYLGWIKFGPEVGETEFTGAFTKWFPDLTPPTFEVLTHDGLPIPILINPGTGMPIKSAAGTYTAWIPNESAIGTITWPEFSDENDSSMDLIHSSIKVTLDPSTDFTGCPSATAQANGNLVMTQNGFGEINLSIPTVGLIGSPLYGFCKYILSGVLYNGSGFGYYFGPDGVTMGDAKGLHFETDLPSVYAPNVYNPDSITLLVRAGDANRTSSSIAFSGSDGVADGNNLINLTFKPKDIGGNPIIPVRTGLVPPVLPTTLPETDPTLWVRDVNLTYDLDQTSNYYFDSLNLARNFIPPDPPIPSPVMLDSQYYSVFDSLLFSPVATPIAGSYLMDLTGFAPTSVSNVLHMDEISLTAVDAEVPAISPTQPAKPADSYLTAFNNSNPVPGASLPYSYSFSPALEVTSGVLDSDFIILGQSAVATFEFINNSTDPLPSYGLDNILLFKDSGGIGQAVLELTNINLLASSDPAGRTDPSASATRYELLHDSGTPASNKFHSSTQNYHAPIYDFSNSVDSEGVYQVDGKYYVAPSDPCLVDSSCTPVDIDRSDSLVNDLNAGDIGSFTFGFTASQYVGQAANSKITFAIDQYLAYHSPNNPFPQYALYPAAPYINGVEVKSIGIGTSGIVGGQQVFESVSGRDLQTITTTSSADLRRDIRKNVAVLTRNITPCEVSGTLSLASLPTDPLATTCLAIDATNKTLVAIYSGSSSDVLELGNGSNVSVPDYKYTIILTGGLNLSLSENLTYNGNLSNSLGIIVMQDDTNKGGNVYLDPNPTNMVGLLYAEGSLLSSPDGGTTFYNGAGGSVSDLKNQLYWQGSLASRNTIGGAPSKIVPDGVGCTPWGNRIVDCAQAYDLDYLRRFTTTHATLQNVDYSPAGYMFSGGGQCNPGLANNPGCTLGGLPTTVKLKTNPPLSPSIDVTSGTGSKSLDTFFIERDNRPVPPGFSSGGGLTSSQEIR